MVIFWLILMARKTSRRKRFKVSFSNPSVLRGGTCVSQARCSWKRQQWADEMPLLDIFEFGLRNVYSFLHYSFLHLKPTFLHWDEFMKHLFVHFIDRGQEMFLDRMDIMQRNGCQLKVRHSVNPSLSLCWCNDTSLNESSLSTQSWSVRVWHH